MHPIYSHLVGDGATFGETEGARRFVIDYGCAFTAAPLPKGIRRRKPGTCYESCAKIVLDNRPEFFGIQYVEGFAMRPSAGVPVKHAWLSHDGLAIDPTWRNPGGGDDLDCLYFGVMFPLPALAAIIAKRRYFGLLDPADEFVRRTLEGSPSATA